MQNFVVWIQIGETVGLARENEPIRIGIPFPRGLVFDTDELVTLDQNSKTTPSQYRVMALWPDGSIKWVLFDAIVCINANEHVKYKVQRREPSDGAKGNGIATFLRVQEGAEKIVVDTGAGKYSIARDAFGPFHSVMLGTTDILSSIGADIRLIAEDGEEYSPLVDNMRLEEYGSIRATVLVEGGFSHGKQRIPLLFSIRLIFHANSNRVRMECLIRNTQAAHHPGGLWDLGDKGSFRFKDFSIRLYPRGDIKKVQWYTEDHSLMKDADISNFNLYQDSSGGENWDSPNHVNSSGNLTVSFSGYRLTTSQSDENRQIYAGQRATPCLRVGTTNGWIEATTKDFWQNFPKAIRFNNMTLSIGLFPSECQHGFELQGGEQKRHTVFINFSELEKRTEIPFMQYPLTVSVDPTWIEQSDAVSWFSQGNQECNQTYLEYINNIIEGQSTFFHKRESIDEYGWRNYGDLYADHEAINHSGPKPLIAHYNNQYDFIYGALIQFLRTGDTRWRTLMDAAAEHTIDIDMYHTNEDRPAYNHGLFWHTDHYLDAATCTHRTYSRRNARGVYGGGPSNEHNYTTGLLNYYYLTGDSEAANAVIELATWVMEMDDGTKTLLGLIDSGPTGAASQTVDTDYHKPGRGAGNSINALIDAYTLCGNRSYFAKAEELIQRCIHPKDAIEELNLNEPEYRWSYLVFLQILGKYLETKISLGEIDYLFCYARDSLLHYADWMSGNEIPYKDVLHKVLLPTETWPAQDIRKSHVFYLAERYSHPDKQPEYRRKAQFFFERCLTDLLSFKTKLLTRPLVILCSHGYVHAYFQKNKKTDSEYIKHQYNYLEPRVFLSQRSRLRGNIYEKRKLLVSELSRLLATKWREFVFRLQSKN
jgi:hypothetical protein